jgi:hypothetical protein
MWPIHCWYIYILYTSIDYRYVQVGWHNNQVLHASCHALMPDTGSNSCRKSADHSKIQCCNIYIYIYLLSFLWNTWVTNQLCKFNRASTSILVYSCVYINTYTYCVYIYMSITYIYIYVYYIYIYVYYIYIYIYKMLYIYTYYVNISQLPN